MSEHPDEHADQPAEAPDEGEGGRDEVAGARGGQPGYDLDEGAVYEEAGEDE